jgi:hypothetical protein
VKSCHLYPVCTSIDPTAGKKIDRNWLDRSLLNHAGVAIQNPGYIFTVDSDSLDNNIFKGVKVRLFNRSYIPVLIHCTTWYLYNYTRTCNNSVLTTSKNRAL